MTPRPLLHCAAAFALFATACGVACAQQALGSVGTQGVEVGGTVTVSGGRAVIANNGSVTASGQAADVTLARGGSVKVCTSSSARLSQAVADVAKPPLLMALNRGGMEVHTVAQSNDVILTPDFRFQASDSAPLNLQIRLVANGDTCVDNSGKDAPIIHATEAFGTGAYFIRPGQRVLFEHGSLRDVVDHETSSCGCPKTEPLVLAGKGKRGDGKVTEAARTNPFPEAVSQGLQQPVVPQAPPEEAHVQVSTTLNYSGTANTVTGPPGEITGATSPIAASAATGSSGAGGAPSTSGATSPALSGPPASAAPAQSSTRATVQEAGPPPAGPNPFRSIGHFFRRLFGGK